MASIEKALPDATTWVSFNVASLPPRALNWLAACIENPLWLAEGYMDGSEFDLVQDDDEEPPYAPVFNQRQLGVLIDRELIGTIPVNQDKWLATSTANDVTFSHQGDIRAHAALRVFIAKYLGNEVKVPNIWAT